MFNRLQTHKILIGNVQIGHQNKVVIQSMTNTKTSDVAKTINQIKRLIQCGAELVRVAILDQADVIALKEITKISPCPIIADIHYNYRFALMAIENGAAKIRINPVNIDTKYLKKIVDVAKEHCVAIRIGINQGSRLNKKKFNTPQAMINCAQRFIKLFETWNFFNIVVSLKSSDPSVVTNLYELAAQKIKYPLHLGVTETGTQTNAIIKSCIGLVPLLQKGIGDTIRISVTGDPVVEPIIAKKILNNIGLYQNTPNIVSCPTCGRLQWNLLDLLKQVETFVNKINVPIKIAIMGCAVNGIGECEHADVGVYGDKNKLFLYQSGKLVKQINHKDEFKTIKASILQVIKRS